MNTHSYCSEWATGGRESGRGRGGREREEGGGGGEEGEGERERREEGKREVVMNGEKLVGLRTHTKYMIIKKIFFNKNNYKKNLKKIKKFHIGEQSPHNIHEIEVHLYSQV